MELKQRIVLQEEVQNGKTREQTGRFPQGYFLDGGESWVVQYHHNNLFPFLNQIKIIIMLYSTILK